MKFKNEKLSDQYHDKNNEFENDIIMFFLIEKQVMLMYDEMMCILHHTKFECQVDEIEISIWNNQHEIIFSYIKKRSYSQDLFYFWSLTIIMLKNDYCRKMISRC